MRSERDLAAALRRAADGAPGPVDLLAGLGERRRRRTRQRYRTALAAAGVVAVAVGGTAVVRGGQQTAAVANRPPATSTTVTAEEPAKPAREVWPEAVFTMPKKASDGSAYRPVTALSPTEILVRAESSFEVAGRLEVYDLANHTSRVVTEMAPHGKGYFEQRAEAGPGHIAWYGTRPDTHDTWADFWVAPLQGGRSVRVGEVTGALAEVETIGVSADHVVWSPKSGGVYRIPIGGGEAEKMPDTDGLWLLAWPWTADVPVGMNTSDTSDRNQSLLVNLETGERRAVTAAAGVHGLRCAVEWCVGRSGDHLVAQRLDGSATRDLPSPSSEQTAYGGRFVWIGHSLYDIATGRPGMLSAVGGDGPGGMLGRGVSSSPTSVFYWSATPAKPRRVCRKATAEELKQLAPPGGEICNSTPVEQGDTYEVLNLAAIPEE
ncbi:hypothetical protein [Microbispora sp. CA-102843]|uniref:hypothetical protein n=1 Tax=Microbispora sp. CA-102843 TaxID=3239952 RepID=UPI003D94E3DB